MPEERTWALALDAFEARLQVCAKAGDRHDELALAPWPPPGLSGPVPPALVDRARHLLAQAASIEAALTARQQELPPLRQRGFAPTAPASRSGSRFSASL
ncbi:MAG: hypothetical protein AAF467_28385 [Actinomycetota bacterium]